MQHNRFAQCSCGCCVACVGPTGPQGPPGTNGTAGPTGPQGAQGPIAATIPFSISSQFSSGIELITDAAGDPQVVNFAGFGTPASYSIFLQPGEWNSGTVTIAETTPYPSSFIMPYDGTLKNIYVLFANRNTLFLQEGVTMRPFVCIAVSDGINLVFTRLLQTMTFTAPYLGAGEENPIPKYTLRQGSLTDLNVAIPAGTLVGILVGWMGEGVTAEEYGQFSVSGGLYLE